MYTHTQADEDALMKAARDGNVEEVLRLLEKGVNINFKDWVSVLHFCRLCMY